MHKAYQMKLLKTLSTTVGRICLMPCALCLISLSVFADDDTTPTQNYIDKTTAVVRVLNKAAGKTQTVNITVGAESRVDNMNVMVRACRESDPFAPADNFAFIEITKNNSQIFSGWMSSTNPGENPLQDADYDLWLVNCK